VAVKQVKSADLLSLSAPQTFALFLQECWAMNFLQHPKVITLVGVCFQPMSMVLEFMEEGDLRKYLDTHADLSWPLRLSLLSDIAEGMSYAHSQWPPIIHKDLKLGVFSHSLYLSSLFLHSRSPNIFLTRHKSGRLIAKVADLGLAEVLPKASKIQGVDNPIWAAAEIIQGDMCSEKVDVWSFAIMVSPPYIYIYISVVLMTNLQDVGNALSIGVPLQ
jgi:serine/threonine protein kinase